MSRSAADPLAGARAGLARLAGPEALAAMSVGGVPVDIRHDPLRQRQARSPARGSSRATSSSDAFAENEGARDPRLPGREWLPIVLCAQGSPSSLAAAALRQLDLARATDVT